MDFEKTDYHATITKIKSKTPSISGLATSAVLITIENKTPGASNLVKKKKWHKISDIENKYITTADYNKFTQDIVAN